MSSSFVSACRWVGQRPHLGRTIPAPRARGVVNTPPVTKDGIPCVPTRRSAPAPPRRSRAMSCTRRTTPQSPSSTGDQSVPLGAPPPTLGTTGWRQRDAKRRRRLARRWVVAPCAHGAPSRLANLASAAGVRLPGSHPSAKGRRVVLCRLHGCAWVLGSSRWGAPRRKRWPPLESRAPRNRGRPARARPAVETIAVRPFLTRRQTTRRCAHAACTAAA